MFLMEQYVDDTFILIPYKKIEKVLTKLNYSQDLFIARRECSPNPHLCRICNTVVGANQSTAPLVLQ